MQNIPKITRGLGIERMPLRRCPSINHAIPIAIPRVPEFPRLPNVIPLPCPPGQPPFCRYVNCKNPDACKQIGVCYVDWEPELIKE
jgi:hypothetical protein